jgi:hypothetical protein
LGAQSTPPTAAENPTRFFSVENLFRGEALLRRKGREQANKTCDKHSKEPNHVALFRHILCTLYSHDEHGCLRIPNGMLDC